MNDVDFMIETIKAQTVELVEPMLAKLRRARELGEAWSNCPDDFPDPELTRLFGRALLCALEVD